MTQAVASTRRWTAADVPAQHGRTAVVTGANAGIGFATAALLAERGAHVVMACRNQDKAAAARDRIRAATPNGSVSLVELDLTSLSSIRTAADAIRREFAAIDLLINNAGVMWPPRQQTADGFELQFGTNHLGHFALTGLLLERMMSVPGSRVVTVSSVLHWNGKIDFDDPNSRQRYNRFRSYRQSKLANLMFTNDLQRRLVDAGAATIAVAAHPGVASTELTRHLPAWAYRQGSALTGLFLNTAEQGALPSLRAATDPAVRGGDFYGPRALLRGLPGHSRSAARARDTTGCKRLWDLSQQLTGVAYDLRAHR